MIYGYNKIYGVRVWKGFQLKKFSKKGALWLEAEKKRLLVIVTQIHAYVYNIYIYI